MATAITPWPGGFARPLVPAALVGPVMFLALVCAAPAWLIYETWTAQQTERDAWNISGPACAVIDHPTPALFGAKEPQTFSYGGAGFSRRFGHASCASPLADGLVPGAPYRVCQFNGPAAVAVTTPAGTTYFKPGVGNPATITIRDGKVSCVVGGWFRA